jgi:hypothetical protein
MIISTRFPHPVHQTEVYYFFPHAIFCVKNVNKLHIYNLHELIFTANTLWLRIPVPTTNIYKKSRRKDIRIEIKTKNDKNIERPQSAIIYNWKLNFEGKKIFKSAVCSWFPIC